MKAVNAPLLRGVLTLAGLGLGVLWWQLDGLDQGLGLTEMLIFAVAAAIVEPLLIRQPRGLPISVSVAVIATAIILGASPVVTAAMAGVAWIVGSVIRKDPNLKSQDLLGRMVAVWALTGLAAVGQTVMPYVWRGNDPQVASFLSIGATVAVSVGILVGLPASQALAETQGRRRHLLKRVWEAVVGTRLAGPTIVATAVLGALVYPVLGVWTLPTMLIPLLAARVGLQRLFVSDRAYEQTIRAMSRLPERFDDGPVGPVPRGHGVRVGQLAREVALEVGLPARRVTDVVRAAHLHELGHIELENDADPTAKQLAAAGGRVVRQVSSQLEPVAAIVETHGDLQSVPIDDDEVGLPARIIAACCVLDRYGPDLGERSQREETVVRLVRDVGDLTVVSALLRVLDRQDGAWAAT